MTQNKKKLYLKTYGCQMNVYDSQRIIDLLAPIGYTVTESPLEADLSILNTCHIREKAEQKVYSDLGRLREARDERRKTNQDMDIAVAGCVAQAEGDEILKQAPYVNLVVGPQTYHRLPEMIAQLNRQKDIKKGAGRGIVDVDFPIESKFDTLPQTSESRVSTFLAVQEGCDKFCTFCVVPYTRGAEYSRPVTEIIKEAKHLLEMGAKEITLLGQNVNAYHGKSAGGTEIDLGALIQELANLEGLERIRYTTSHPKDMNESLMRAHRDVPQLMPYLHLPVQSGSDRVLKAMNRKHTARHYLDIIETIRSYRSDIALSSDFIVGFPGESDKDFEETLDLVRAVVYDQAYSFAYSIRPGTPAGSMELQVPEHVKSSRLKILQDLLNEQQLEKNQKTVYTKTKVLLDRKGKHPGQLIGKTPYMQSVYLDAPERLIGSIVDVQITGAFANSLTGEIITTERVASTPMPLCA